MSAEDNTELKFRDCFTQIHVVTIFYILKLRKTIRVVSSQCVKTLMTSILQTLQSALSLSSRASTVAVDGVPFCTVAAAVPAADVVVVLFPVLLSARFTTVVLRAYALASSISCLLCSTISALVGLN